MSEEIFMKNIIAVSDLQRQAAQVLNAVKNSPDPIIITQRGRAAAVIISAKRYAQIEEDLADFDDLALEQLVAEGRRAKEAGDFLTLDEVKRRLNYHG